MAGDDRPSLPYFEIPARTIIMPPDDLNRIVMLFPDQNSAILFFEFFREVGIRAEENDQKRDQKRS